MCIYIFVYTYKCNIIYLDFITQYLLAFIPLKCKPAILLCSTNLHVEQNDNNLCLRKAHIQEYITMIKFIRLL